VASIGNATFHQITSVPVTDFLALNSFLLHQVKYITTLYEEYRVVQKNGYPVLFLG